MIRHWGLACLSVSLGLALACERDANVADETRDLAEAQKNTGNVAKELEGQLEKAKAEVIELENKLARAREGITDEVLEERKELQQALDSQRRELREDINEAQREAQALNKDADRAIQQLQQTQPPAHVDTTLKTETDVVPGTPQPVESTTREEVVPVRGVETPPPSDAPPADDATKTESTTTTTRSVPPAPAPETPPPAAPAPPPAAPPPAAPPSTEPAPVTPPPAP